MSTLALTLPSPVDTPGTRAGNGRLTSDPRGRKGRPFYADTPLGRLIDERGHKVYEVTSGCSINPRIMSDYLNGRKAIRPQDKVRLAQFLNVQVEDL